MDKRNEKTKARIFEGAAHSRKRIELTSPAAINFSVFRRIKPCLVLSQYQPKLNPPKAAKIRVISRKLTRKVRTCLPSFSENAIEFSPIYVRIILRGQIFQRKSLKGEVICGYCKPFRRIYPKNMPLKTGLI